MNPDDKNGPKTPNDSTTSEREASSRAEPRPLSEAADIRHTLRTPLNHIIGYSEMLLEEAEERGIGEFAADLQKIRAAGKTLLGLINEKLGSNANDGNSWRFGMESANTAAPIRGQGQQRKVEPSEVVVVPKSLSGRILVVDDNDTNRDMLSRRLAHEGFAVATAENGAQALTLLRSTPVDLILLDVMMPEMDGYEVLTQLKSDGIWREIPVIMISALDEIESVVRCIERGAEDYLAKPFDPVLLRARIGACLEKKRFRDQEILYLKDVAHVTAAAGAVENGRFEADLLTEVSKRDDELGQLARVFQQMAREVAAREEQLKQQIQVLRIEIDQSKKARQVSEITDTDYFQDLQKKAKALRRRLKT